MKVTESDAALPPANPLRSANSMSQPLNIGSLNITGAAGQQQQQPSLAYSTSPVDQFSPPKHHYPLSNGNGTAAAAPGSFSARMMTSPKQSNGFPASSPSSAGLPAATSMPKSPRDRARSLSTTVQAPKVLTPFVPKSIEEQEEKIHPKVLLLENVCASILREMKQADSYIRRSTNRPLICSENKGTS